MQKETTDTSKSNGQQEKFIVVRLRNRRNGTARYTAVRFMMEGRTFDFQLETQDLSIKEVLYSVFETIGTYENFNRGR
jgi:hypothetical protein